MSKSKPYKRTSKGTANKVATTTTKKITKVPRKQMTPKKDVQSKAIDEDVEMSDGENFESESEVEESESEDENTPTPPRKKSSKKSKKNIENEPPAAKKRKPKSKTAPVVMIRMMSLIFDVPEKHPFYFLNGSYESVDISQFIEIKKKEVNIKIFS